MDLLLAAVDPVREQAPPAADLNQAAMGLVADPERDRSDRTESLVEFQVFLCSSFFSAQKAKAQRSQALN